MVTSFTEFFLTDVTFGVAENTESESSLYLIQRQYKIIFA